MKNCIVTNTIAPISGSVKTHILAPSCNHIPFAEATLLEYLRPPLQQETPVFARQERCRLWNKNKLTQYLQRKG